jgi:hypothetical protein
MTRFILPTLSLLLCCPGFSAPEAAPAPPPPPKHDAAKYRDALTDFQTKLGQRSVEHLGWNWLGQASVEFAAGKYDEAVSSYGQALATDDLELASQAHFGLGNTFYRKAATTAADLQKEAVSVAVAGKQLSSKKKDESPSDIDNLISLLEDSLAQYINTLEIKPNHAEAKENKAIVEDLLNKLNEAKKKAEEGKQNQDKQPQSGGEGDGKQEQKQDKKGEKSEQGEGKSKGENGQESGEGDKSKEEKGGEEKSEGKEGNSPGQGEKGAEKGEEEGKGSGSDEQKGQKEDQRSEAEKQAAEAAKEEANKERNGKIAAKDNEGQPQTQEGTKGKESEEGKPDQKMGFNPAQARRLAARLADEAKVRQEHKLPRERVFKNY